MKKPEIIPTSVEEKDALIRALREENALLKQQYLHVLEQFKLSRQRHFARSSESNVLQLKLQFNEAEAVPDEELPQEDNTITMTYSRNKPKRRTLPADLPREVIEHDIPEHETRQAMWPKEILQAFNGYLQTDGYQGYDWVDDNPEIIHLGCMAHARRPFAELAKLAKTTGKSQQPMRMN